MMNIAVIGGGVVGASLAYRLVCQGARVTLIDREDTGRATAAGAGILPPLDHFIGTEELLPLLRQARAYYPRLVAALADDGEHDTGYEVVGALQIALSEAESEKLSDVARQCEAWRASGFTHIGALTELDAAEARRCFPLLTHSVVRALHAAGAARVDGRRLVASLRRAFQKRGGRWEHGGAEIELQGGRAAGVRWAAGSTPVDAVAIATGAWSAGDAKRLGVELPVRPQRGQLVHLDVLGTDTSGWPMVLGFGLQYLLCFPPHRVVAGATREDACGYEASVTAGAVHGVLETALRLAPGLARARVSDLRTGFRPVSADGKPLLGVSPAHSNLYFATGHGGYGLEMGPYSGALVADRMLGNAVSVDLEPFAVGRFRAGTVSRSA